MSILLLYLETYFAEGPPRCLFYWEIFGIMYNEN